MAVLRHRQSRRALYSLQRMCKQSLLKAESPFGSELQTELCALLAVESGTAFIGFPLGHVSLHACTAAKNCLELPFS